MNEEMIGKIQKLKKKRQAVILAHNYQLPEIQDIADHVEDSLGLSIIASKIEAKVILFCGVLFMAETAAILNPDKIVVIPDPHAGCPMADMITSSALLELKAKHPGVPVVSYVNTTADVKAESDICCTSANSVKVVQSLKEPEIIFVPDKYLGAYTAKQVPDKNFILWPGYCPTHARITIQDIKKAREAHPKAEILVHPECPLEVSNAADKVFSTGGMIRYIRESKNNEFVIVTEEGIIYRLQKENPGKLFYGISDLAVCPNMKKNTLEKVLWELESLEHRVVVPENIRLKAKQAIDRMLLLT
ncbi:MAG: quinolinate synthase NadA [Candidatus Saganbacteria bacterium]|nr:quinolinate synthase NadA [Candidatus Saganbacteria bacterium]